MSQKSGTRRRRGREVSPDDIVCPFCGKVSAAKDRCTSCQALFSKEVLKVAYTVADDPREDGIGPVPTKWAKAAGIVLIILLIAAFVAATEMSGAGISSSGS